MKIIVDRDSVCAGDDAFVHEMTFEVPESLTIYTKRLMDVRRLHGKIFFGK